MQDGQASTHTFLEDREMKSAFKVAGNMILALGAVMLVVTAYNSADAKDAPAKVTIKAKQGDVSFDHAKHAKDLKIACKTCHHKMDTDKDKMGCESCHKAEKGDSPSMKDAAHKKCQGCHKEKADPKAPTACKDCHKK